MTWLQILWMPSIIRVRDVISGCDQAFLHFLAAWLHRKNEPKKKLTRIDSGAPSWTVTPAISRILFYGSKKSCLIYFQICPPRSACHPLCIVYRIFFYNYYEQEGSQNGGSKVIMSEIDCVSVKLGALLSTQVSCLFGSLLQYNQAARKWRNAWSQLLAWWSKFFFCKIKRFFA